jgi:hypothetical protein
VTSEGRISDEVRLALSDEGVCVWRNNIAKAEIRGRWVAFGVGGPGGADLIGLWHGRFVAIEVKTPVGKQTEEQRRFAALVQARGGEYVVLRSADEAHAWAAEIRRKYA